MRQTEPPRTGPVLVVIGGLPATGKSTVGRAHSGEHGRTTGRALGGGPLGNTLYWRTTGRALTEH